MARRRRRSTWVLKKTLQLTEVVADAVIALKEVKSSREVKVVRSSSMVPRW
jgi:hypothetical protein